MSQININVNKLNECGSDIVELSISYNTLIQDMFELLENLKNNNVLIGEDDGLNSASIFVDKIKKEKNIYTAHGQSLNRCGNIITELSQKVGPNNWTYATTINFSSEPLKNDVLPHTKGAKGFLEGAINENNKANFDPNTKQGYVNEELRGIISDIGKFNSWVESKIGYFDGIVSETLEEARGVNAENVEKRQSIVKSTVF